MGALKELLLDRTWTQWPAPTAAESYAEAVEDFAERAMKLESVEAVYQIGSLSAPGISDIDVIVVLRNGAAERSRRINHLPRSGPHPGLWTHDPLVLDQQAFEQLPYLFPVFSSGRVAARGEAPAEIRSNASAELQLVHLAIMCLIKVPRALLAEIAMHRSVNVRQVLLLVSSFRYTARLAAEANSGYADGMNPEWEAFSTAVESLRQEWFGLPRDLQRARLAEAAEHALDVAFQVCAAAGLTVERWLPQVPLPESGARVSGFFPGRVAGRGPGLPEARDLATMMKELPVVQLEPGVVAFFRTMASRSDGPYERYLRRHFGAAAPTRVDPELARTVDRHIAAVNGYVRFSRNQLRERPSPYLALGAGEPTLRRLARLAYHRWKRFSGAGAPSP